MVPLNATATALPISCNGGSTSVQVSATGGVPPYVGIGNFQVFAGSYNYIITDAAGNRDTTTLNLSQPATIVVSASYSAILTTGGTTTVLASVTGGTPSYNYSLNGGAYQSSNQFTQVPAGNHVIYVKDSKGCTSSRSFTIQAPAIAPLKVSTTIGRISCYGGSALVTVEANGGVPPYSGTGTFSYTAGNYTVSVRDAAGNVTTANITLTQPSSINVVATDITDTRTNTGLSTYSLSATGGVPPYRYSLDGGSQQTSSIFSGITSGTHTFSVIDSNNCMKVITVNVAPVASQPLTLTLLSKSDLTCKGANNGKIEVMASGGRAPYQYAIKNSPYGSSNIFTNLRPGYYRILVKDANQTVISIVVRIGDSQLSCSNTGRQGSIINIYPNPSTSNFNIKLESENNEETIVEAFNNLGTKVWSKKTNSNSSLRFGEDFKSGFYIVNVIQKDKKQTIKIIKL
jgi:hypothetical protein